MIGASGEAVPSVEADSKLLCNCEEYGHDSATVTYSCIARELDWNGKKNTDPMDNPTSYVCKAIAPLLSDRLSYITADSALSADISITPLWIGT